MAASGVEGRREEVLSHVRKVATVTLLQVVGIDQLLDLILVVTSVDEELLVGELVDELVGQLPQLTHNECHVRRVEPEQTPSVVLGHIVDEGLDAIFGDLSDADVLQIEDARPRLDRAWDHRMLDNVEEEEVGEGEETIDWDAGIDHAAHE